MMIPTRDYSFPLNYHVSIAMDIIACKTNMWMTMLLLLFALYIMRDICDYNFQLI